MAVTIKQIAKEAGVSVTTVSNVINKRAHRVSLEKRDEIERLIKKYNYTPNMNARSLVNSSSNLIGLLYYSETENVNFSDPFVAEVLAGIEEKSRELGYFVLAHNIQNSEDVELVQRNWKFEGFIVVMAAEDIVQSISDTIHYATPIIFIDTHLARKKKDRLVQIPNRYFVCSEDFVAGYKITEYIISKGHRQIAFLSFKYNEEISGVIQERYQGFSEALTKRGVSLREENCFFDVELEKLLQQLERFTAIVCTSDLLAARLLHEIRKQGNQVEISVTGFDDIEFAKLMTPPLTTIRINNVKKGETALDLLNKIKAGQDTGKKYIELPVKLIERESVKRITE